MLGSCGPNEKAHNLSFALEKHMRVDLFKKIFRITSCWTGNLVGVNKDVRLLSDSLGYEASNYLCCSLTVVRPSHLA